MIALAAVAQVPGCASRGFNTGDEALPTATAQAPRLRDDGVMSHTGPFSPFDRVVEGKSSESASGAELVSTSEAAWACLSRPEVTVCRGRNGAGRGVVLWVRYRGTLVQRSTATVPVFLQVSVNGVKDSFPMITDANGAQALLSDGLTSCKATTGAEIYTGVARSSCTEVPPRMKDLFKALGAQEARKAPWRVSVGFGVTLQDPHEKSPRVETDKGSPPFEFEVPEVLPDVDNGTATEPKDARRTGRGAGANGGNDAYRGPGSNETPVPAGDFEAELEP